MRFARPTNIALSRIAGLLLGVMLAATAAPSAAAGAPGEPGGVVEVRLIGVTKYELVEIFNDLLGDIPGVVEARRYRLHLETGNPGACFVNWRVRMEGIDIVRLESALYKRLRTGEDSETVWNRSQFTFQPTAEDLELLAAIRPRRATSREIEFLLDPATGPARRQTWNLYPKDGSWHYRFWAGFE
jgi:hypothetical protein